MKRFSHSLTLVGPTGDTERWTVCASPTLINDKGRRQRFNKGDCGHTDWINRILTINSRLRNATTIHDTILHEIVHVTSGQNGSEQLAANIEGNYRSVNDRFISEETIAQ